MCVCVCVCDLNIDKKVAISVRLVSCYVNSSPVGEYKYDQNGKQEQSHLMNEIPN